MARPVCAHCGRWPRLHSEARAITCALALYGVPDLPSLQEAVEAERRGERVPVAMREVRKPLPKPGRSLSAYPRMVAAQRAAQQADAAAAPTVQADPAAPAGSYAESIGTALMLMNRHGYDVAAIEAWMRLGCATLDYLNAQEFLAEVAVACSCIDQAPAHRTALLSAIYGLNPATVEG